MQTIIKEFENFMLKHGTHYHQFYIGIATDPEDRLINGHGINETIPNIYWSTSLHTSIVRDIERYFLDKGTRGGSGGGGSNTNYIYAYLITPETRE